MWRWSFCCAGADELCPGLPQPCLPSILGQPLQGHGPASAVGWASVSLFAKLGSCISSDPCRPLECVRSWPASELVCLSISSDKHAISVACLAPSLLAVSWNVLLYLHSPVEECALLVFFFYPGSWFHMHWSLLCHWLISWNCIIVYSLKNRVLRGRFISTFSN